MMYWVQARTVSRHIAVRIPVAACYYFATTKRNNNITRGIPLSPPKIISRGEIQGVKILLNGDWQSSLDRSTPTVES